MPTPSPVLSEHLAQSCGGQRISRRWMTAKLTANRSH
jgi:hypothetical protein